MPDFALLQAPHSDLLRAALAAATSVQAHCALDLACGQGQHTPWLQAACVPEALVVGLDIAHDALKAAGPGAWLAGDALHLPLRSAVCDLIWCVAAWQFFANRRQALREMGRVLRPGGQLVLTLAGERWVRLRTWAAEQPNEYDLVPADELGNELNNEIVSADFIHNTVAAYLLDPVGLDLDAARRPLAQLICGEPLVIGEPEAIGVLLVVTAQRAGC
ncbi:MAG: class I SAM-dependent methyltransferase [Candidatus Viridilinea halotolerans]|uniref:Class I SAM-dependent methyltransferase n=1 Tax=Candidatus Viridilinea halotolerans TaxID=2491704 RepID=A0A426U4F4_9CHLR|nr:MAG: class I SAM-dependent methyltransferase [Candidatus Viridilinea halotolerans]